MWGNFGDLTKKLAERAAAAAENIEGQLNESVGASPEALAEMKKKGLTATGNLSSSLPPTKETLISDDEDPFNEDDDFYDDDSLDIDMHEDDNANVEKLDEEESVSDPSAKDGADPSGDRLADLQSIQEKDVVEDPEAPEETVFIDDIQPAHSDIQDEGLYDDDEEEEEEEEGIDVDDFGQTQVDQENDGASSSVEESNEIEAETTLDNEQESNAEVVHEEELETIFDNEQESNAPALVEDEEQEVTEPEPPMVQVEESTMMEDIPSPPKETDTFDNVLYKAAAKLQNLQNDEIQENQNIEVDDEPIDIVPNIEETPDDVIGEQGDLSPVIDETPLEVSGEPSDTTPVTPAEEEPSQIDAQGEEIYDTDSEESVYVSKEEADALQNRHSFDNALKLQLQELQKKLAQREDQLSSKSAQIMEMVETHEKETSLLESKIKETKEEAKKRINKAREKVDDIKVKLADANARASSVGSTSSEQEGLIAALREEGENLARKQSDMEYLVREARGNIRDLKNQLETEKAAKEKAEGKIAGLESERKITKTELSAAKQKGGLADKLDSDLLVAKEEREKNASIILGLEAKLKESKSRNKELQKEMEQALEDKVSQLEYETASIRIEKDLILKDLETKLRTSEREANLREDSLRREVAELRKRWQEAVRRCDALSIDLQQSSAPLLRQLESTERQNRARAAAWAELETKLRSETEENFIEKENLQKERNDLEADIKKTRRSLQGKESELALSQSRVEDLSTSSEEISTRYEHVVSELDSLKIECSNLQQYLKDTESKARTEFIGTLRENEDRFNDNIESLEVELRQERDKRESLEEKIEEMMATSQVFVGSTRPSVQNGAKSPKRNLGSISNQADILHDTLLGLGPDDDDDDDDMNNSNLNDQGTEDQKSNSTGSFAFIEQLSQALKATKSERDTLHKQLTESEERRGVLENEAVASQEATKDLPLLKAQVAQLTREVNEKDMEIQALQEDINDVRDMYKSQLNTLIGGEVTNGSFLGTVPPSKPSAEVKQTSEKPVIPSSFTGMRTF